LARLRALRGDLIDPTIAVHNGRVFKRTGDGALVEFDAVRCAIEVQNAMIERNAGVAHDRRIEFRIGIHVGDVVEESDGVMMGDSVNIAARLEGIAKPGPICLSHGSYRQVPIRIPIVQVEHLAPGFGPIPDEHIVRDPPAQEPVVPPHVGGGEALVSQQHLQDRPPEFRAVRDIDHAVAD
jgi:class 3 adenylate cyclase